MSGLGILFPIGFFVFLFVAWILERMKGPEERIDELEKNSKVEVNN
ncbi:hypothetical protein [Halobacillus sp. BBL2006]|nr:hypothetical protein [Halobacillus sp. BBL2006]